jgi:hypothetical protein
MDSTQTVPGKDEKSTFLRRSLASAGIREALLTEELKKAGGPTVSVLKLYRGQLRLPA